MYDLVDPFYERIPDTMDSRMYATGQMFWAPALYRMDTNPMDILVATYDPSKDDYTYGVGKAAPDDFEKPGIPIQPLGVMSNERVALVRCKMRPVIVVSHSGEVWQEPTRRGGKDCYVVAPVYSFQGDESKVAYPEDFINRVKVYMYNKYFYLPASERPPVREGFVRFDHMQVMHKSWLQFKPIRLSEMARACLEAWLSLYVSPETTSEVCQLKPPEAVDCMPRFARFILDYREMKVEEFGYDRSSSRK